MALIFGTGSLTWPIGSRPQPHLPGSEVSLHLQLVLHSLRIAPLSGNHGGGRIRIDLYALLGPPLPTRWQLHAHVLGFHGNSDRGHIEVRRRRLHSVQARLANDEGEVGASVGHVPLDGGLRDDVKLETQRHEI